MLRNLRHWMIARAKGKAAQFWLCFIAFIENSVFPLPTDILFIPLALLRRDRAYHYAFIASLFSTLGGISGWFLGSFAYETLAHPILTFYGKDESFNAFAQYATPDIMVLLLLSSGFFHLPPIKIITILAGALHFPLIFFIPITLLTRVTRFYFLAWLIQRYGQVLHLYILPRLKWFALAGFITIVGVWALFWLANHLYGFSTPLPYI
ncbi:YqaA family protein [Bartonella sp. DGB2]|uniref:YqaA family protein n=1 Tax=Bartonella sp. DGB2 TaxID=3388426 RepID=UPI0039901838